jgi:hypothetical protein
LWCADLRNYTGFLIALVVLLVFYLPTMQTIPNGSDHYYMADVGETQIVLNTWGTLHSTGYPLYVISGNMLVAALRVFGVAPVIAPALVSLLWSIVALALIYTLALHLINSPRPEGEGQGVRAIVPALVLLFGLTRTVWIHAVIAEIYSFGLVILALLYLLALWRSPIPHRIYWLAFVGGVGVFHHRALLMAAPALVYAAWPELTAQPRKLPRILALSLLLGLLGFLPYLYLPIRAQSGAAWVYGEPGTWTGFWDQFTGREAERFIGLPGSWDALLANFNTVNTVLVTDVTVPGILLGVIGLLVGLTRYRRPAMTLLISALTAYIFHIALYRDILSALILPITLSLAFGWLFLTDWLLSRVGATCQVAPTIFRLSAILLVLLSMIVLANQNRPFITDLVQNPTGLDTIAQAQNTPPGSTLMIAWGARHFAVGFARDVLGKLQDIRLVDHKADFAAIVAQGMLVTPEYTFYNQPVSWWEDRLGARVYLRAIALYLVQIDTQPELADSQNSGELSAIEQAIHCTPDSIVLGVDWFAPETPDHDLSVFVHLHDADGNVIAQADQSAPVYGWRPLTTWTAGEIVRDVYVLPRLANAARVRYGLYQQLSNGEFDNELQMVVPVECDEIETDSQ